MAIAISLGASGALASYNDFLDEIRDQLDDDSMSQERIDRALRKAEAHFNRELRVPDMETSFTLAVTGETAALPIAFLQLRTIYVEGDRDRTLRSMSPLALTSAFLGLSGAPEAYSIIGRALKFAPVGAGSVVIEYYQKIPALGPDTQSNWLLDRHPDLYVAGTLYHLHRRSGDNAEADRRLAETQGMIASINLAGQNARWGQGPLVPAGVMQVRGARA